MKTFKQISAQLERIHMLYLHGYGTRQMIEQAERFVFMRFNNVGLMF